MPYFVVVVAVGFLSSRRQRATVGGYFRAGNQLPFYAIGFSIVAAGISSEQFVGEIGYAYKLGLPVANWEWLVLPGMSAMLWIFIPLYVRNNIATMPEYLGRRFGGRARTLLAVLTIASYVLVNFALVFYTGGFALEQMWGIPRLAAVWGLALVTGAYTVYGGLMAVAWTSSLQCVLLLGGGLYVFVAGMARIHWDWAALLGAGPQAHLFTPADHEVPWTALVVLMLSTNVWYYATNQYINQCCLPALQACRAVWLEEPFESGAWEAYRDLARHSGAVQLAGGEGCHNFHHARNMMDYAGLEADTLCEYPFAPSALARAFSTTKLLPDAEGRLGVPDRPGLGVEPDAQALAPYLPSCGSRTAGALVRCTRVSVRKFCGNCFIISAARRRADFQAAVAQVCNLQAVPPLPPGLGNSRGLPNAIRRYGRLKICAIEPGASARAEFVTIWGKSRGTPRSVAHDSGMRCRSPGAWI